MNRALRRFYAGRWKTRAKRRVLRWSWITADGERFHRLIGIGAKSRKPCSNYCCGNRRKFEGRSLQERKNYDNYLSQLEELQ